MVVGQPVLASLQAIPFFAGLEPGALEHLAATMRSRRFKRGEVLFHLGDPGDALFVIVSGEVKISLPSDTGEEAILATLGPGQVFGELALLDGSPRSASATALVATETVVLPRERFRELEDARRFSARGIEERGDFLPQHLLRGGQRDAMARKADVRAPALERAVRDRLLQYGFQQRLAVAGRKGGAKGCEGAAGLAREVGVMLLHLFHQGFVQLRPTARCRGQLSAERPQASRKRELAEVEIAGEPSQVRHAVGRLPL